MIRQLTITDLDQAVQIAQLKPVRNEAGFMSYSFVENIVMHPDNLTLGYFEDDVLISWGSIRFGSLHGEKTWFIVFLFTRNFANHFSFDGPDFGPIMKEFFARAEADEYYSYIYSVPEKSSRAYYRKWGKNVSGRYDTEDVAHVPANTIPTENWISRLNGGVRTYDIVIKKRTLKNEYRKNNSINSD